jgi:hypothetical protein
MNLSLNAPLVFAVVWSILYLEQIMYFFYWRKLYLLINRPIVKKISSNNEDNIQFQINITVILTWAVYPTWQVYGLHLAM